MLPSTNVTRALVAVVAPTAFALMFAGPINSSAVTHTGALVDGQVEPRGTSRRSSDTQGPLTADPGTDFDLVGFKGQRGRDSLTFQNKERINRVMVVGGPASVAQSVLDATTATRF